MYHLTRRASSAPVSRATATTSSSTRNPTPVSLHQRDHSPKPKAGEYPKNTLIVSCMLISHSARNPDDLAQVWGLYRVTYAELFAIENLASKTFLAASSVSTYLQSSFPLSFRRVNDQLKLTTCLLHQAPMRPLWKCGMRRGGIPCRSRRSGCWIIACTTLSRSRRSCE